MYTHADLSSKTKGPPFAPLFNARANNPVHSFPAAKTSPSSSALPVGTPSLPQNVIMAKAVLVDNAEENAPEGVVVAEAVPVVSAPAVSAQVLPAQEPLVPSQALSAQVLPAQGPLVPAQAAPADWLQAIQCYDLNEPFHVRIGAVAGDYYPGAIPAAMADKKVLSMKVKTATGEVRVMHSVPETLVAVGYYNGVDALKEAIRHAKRFKDHAKQTPGKPDNYLNMLVELDSLQELDVKDARGKVFPEYCIFNAPKNMFYDIQLILKCGMFSQPREIPVQNWYLNFVGTKIEYGFYHKNSENPNSSKHRRAPTTFSTPQTPSSSCPASAPSSRRPTPTTPTPAAAPWARRRRRRWAWTR